MNGISGWTRRDLLQGSAALLPLAGFPFAPRGRRDFDPILGSTGGLARGPALAAAGGRYLEVNCRNSLVPEKPDSEFRSRLEALRGASVPAVAANSFLPGHLQCTGPKADHEAVMKYVEVAFARAEQAGITTITFGSSGARSLPEGYDDHDQARLQFTAILARMAPVAARHGVTVSVEPLRKQETNFLNRVSEALPLVRAVDQPNVRITADIYHMLSVDEPPSSIEEAGEYIHHVHIAEKAKRTAPGVAGDDFRPYLRALSRIDYSGRISIECRWSAFDAEIAPALEELRTQLADLG